VRGGRLCCKCVNHTTDQPVRSALEAVAHRSVASGRAHERGAINRFSKYFTVRKKEIFFKIHIAEVNGMRPKIRFEFLSTCLGFVLWALLSVWGGEVGGGGDQEVLAVYTDLRTYTVYVRLTP
jgi:hypothetical protein